MLIAAINTAFYAHSVFLRGRLVEIVFLVRMVEWV